MSLPQDQRELFQNEECLHLLHNKVVIFYFQTQWKFISKADKPKIKQLKFVQMLAEAYCPEVLLQCFVSF